MYQKQISAFSFDLWDTLIKDTPNNLKQRSQLRIKNLKIFFLKKRLDIPKNILENALNDVRNKCIQDHNNEFDISFNQRVEQLIKIISHFESIPFPSTLNKSIGDIINNAFLEYPPYLVEGEITTIENIYNKGYKLAIISNTGFTSPKIYNLFLKNIGLTRYIKIVLLSNHLQTAKPSRTIFKLALNKLGLPCNEVVHIGDNYTADILGSEKCGMKSVWINNVDGIYTPNQEKTDNNKSKDIIIKNILELNKFI